MADQQLLKQQRARREGTHIKLIRETEVRSGLVSDSAIDDFAHKRDRGLRLSVRQVPDVAIRRLLRVFDENVAEIGIVGARDEADSGRITKSSGEGVIGHCWQWCRRSRNDRRMRGRNWGREFSSATAKYVVKNHSRHTFGGLRF